MLTRFALPAACALALLLPFACSSEDDDLPAPTTTPDAGSGAGGQTPIDGSPDATQDAGTGGSAPETCPDRPWQRPDPNGYCAEYELPVELPDCDDGDPEVAIIDADDDWSEINDPAKRIFCVRPGNYQAVGQIQLSSHGTDGAPRIIRYDHPSDADPPHPVAQAEADRVVVAGFRFHGADHWIVDGLTVRPTNTSATTQIWLEDGNHNVLNRLLVEAGGGGAGQVLIRDQGNVLQNCVLRQTLLDPGEDMHCAVVAGSASDFRIVNNEMVDCGGDSIQVHGGTVGGLTVIENNDLYLTDALYTDCSGSLSPAGDCACAENALDMKNGGVDGEPLLVEHNRAWGFRDTDTACSGTGSGGNGFIIHLSAQYILVRNNILMDVPGGIATPNELAHHVSLIGNVVADTLGGAGIGQVSKADHFDGYYNSLIRTGGLSGGGDHDFDCNLPAAESSSNTELCVQIKRWTGPEEICIDHGRLEVDSLSGACQTEAGTTVGYGVDDRIWSPADAIIE